MSKYSPDQCLLKEGCCLNGKWTIKSMIGKGGCGEVYTINESDPVIGKLVVKCAALPVNNLKKHTVKDRELTSIANSLYYEWFLCRQQFLHLLFVPPGPQHDFGEDLGCRYFVMKQLDFDLNHLSTHSRKLPYPTVCEIGALMLTGLKALHDLGYVFVDVSASNFMIEKGGDQKNCEFNPDCDKLYFIDFGLVEKYTEYMLDNRQRKNTHRREVSGSPRYVSIATQQGATPSPRDDIESMGYILLELCCPGKLPWHDGTSDSDILRIKLETNIVDMAASQGCPELGELVVAARQLGYYETPEYSYFNSLLEAMKIRTQTAQDCARSQQYEYSESSLLGSVYGIIANWFSWPSWNSSTETPFTDGAELCGKSPNRQLSSIINSSVRSTVQSPVMSPPNSTDLKKRKRTINSLRQPYQTTAGAAYTDKYRGDGTYQECSNNGNESNNNENGHPNMTKRRKRGMRQKILNNEVNKKGGI